MRHTVLELALIEALQQIFDLTWPSDYSVTQLEALLLDARKTARDALNKART